MKKIIIIISILSVCLLPVIGWAATYYLDQSAAGAGSGASWGDAFTTLSQAQAVAQSGDMVLIRNGNYGQYIERNISRSDWVTYRAEEGHVPILTNIEIDNYPAWQDTYLIFDGLTVNRQGQNDSTAIMPRNARHVKFLNLNIIGNGYLLSQYVPSEPAIRLWGVEDAIIDNCTISGSGDGYLSGFTAGVDGSGTDVVITNCNISECLVGLNIAGDNITISNNEIHKLTSDGIVFVGCNNLTIEYNELHDIKVFRPVLMETVAETIWNLSGTIMTNPNARWNTPGDTLVTVGMEIQVLSGTNALVGDGEQHGGNFDVESISPDGTQITLTRGIADGGQPSNVNYYIKSRAHADLIQANAYSHSYNVTIRGNQLYDNLEAWAFMHLNPQITDEASSSGGHNFLIENNLCWNSYESGQQEYDHPLNANHIEGLVFRNNIVIGRVQVHESYDVRFNNNIVGFIQFYGDVGLIENDYNIFNRGPLSEANSIGLYNTFLNPGYSWNEFNDTSFTSIFADYDNGDFQHASASSLGVGHSNPSNSPAMDILGYERDSSPDAGCYEYGADTLWTGSGEKLNPDSGQDPEPDPDPQPEVEDNAGVVIPDQTLLRISNNIIKSGGNSVVTINCDVKEAGTLTVTIYDSKGKEIITLWNKHEEPGTVPIIWNGADSGGSKVGSGIYLIHMECGGYKETKKIAVVK